MITRGARGRALLIGWRLVRNALGGLLVSGLKNLIGLPLTVPLLLTTASASAQDVLSAAQRSNESHDFSDIPARTTVGCSEAIVLGECESSLAHLFSSVTPGLVGVYGGYDGHNTARSDFVFDRKFAVVRAAWLCLDFSYGGIVDCFGCLDASCGPGGFSSCSGCGVQVPLIPTDTVLDGEGVVELTLFTPCCDQQAWVSAATLWFDATPVPAPTDLLDFAELQVCFSGTGDGASSCDPQDHDGDGDIDLEDYFIFFVALEGP